MANVFATIASIPAVFVTFHCYGGQDSPFLP